MHLRVIPRSAAGLSIAAGSLACLKLRQRALHSDKEHVEGREDYRELYAMKRRLKKRQLLFLGFQRREEDHR